VKMAVVLSLVSVLVGANAMADFKLSQSSKAIVCYADDNQSINLGVKRVKLQYTVEGESLGGKKIVDVQTDGKTFITYSTSELALTLSDAGDSFLYAGDQDSQEVRCQNY
jgi:hypothetical protein